MKNGKEKIHDLLIEQSLPIILSYWERYQCREQKLMEEGLLLQRVLD